VTDSPAPSASSPRGLLGRALRQFRPLHEHSAYSATLLLMSTVLLSRVMGFVREIYIARAFGAGWQTDAYVAAFTIPDWLNYIAAGGTASITFISIYGRFIAEKRDDEAQKTFSIILTVMGAVLLVGIVLGEIFAPQLVYLMFKKFSPQQFELCVFLTRVLLPAQAFFYVGGVVSAVLLARRLFLLPALGPLVYNGGIIVGGILFSRSLGVSSLAYGAVAGSFFGIFLINAIGAARVGAGYRPSFDVRNPAFRHWVKLSIPLMLGVSLVTLDDWILRYFAAGSLGDISRLNYAKRLFQVPIAILGQAAGQASYPFFVRLFEEKRQQEFADSVNGSVYRVVAVSLLFSSFMLSAALPLVDLAYRRGRFLPLDAQETATYFFWFSLSLAFWAAQALYTRAYYASGNTLTPMIASSVVTLASLPVYSVLFRTMSTVGLTIASDIGIAANCMVMAFLLQGRKLVSMGELPWKELGKAGVTALVAGVLSHKIAAGYMTSGSVSSDLKALSLAGITWAAAVAAGLWITRSSLLEDLRRKRARV
jgi:putative peptidoglycan lipid II flippase